MEKFELEEEVERLGYEYLGLLELRKRLGTRSKERLEDKNMIDEVNDALLEIQEEYRALSGHYYYPGKKEINDYFNYKEEISI